MRRISVIRLGIASFIPVVLFLAGIAFGAWRQATDWNPSYDWAVSIIGIVLSLAGVISLSRWWFSPGDAA